METVEISPEEKQSHQLNYYIMLEKLQRPSYQTASSSLNFIPRSISSLISYTAKSTLLLQIFLTIPHSVFHSSMLSSYQKTETEIEYRSLQIKERMNR